MTKPARRSPLRKTIAAAVSLGLAAAAGLGLAAPARAAIPYGSFFGEQRYASIVVDANTGEVLYSKYADAQRHPASITKLMTLYLTFEQLQSGKLSLNDRVPISNHAASMSPTKLGVRPGDAISVDEAVQAAAIKSANDVAVALAEKVGGSEERFAALMTLRAKELGMTSTTYVNASGLPDSRQITSARDLAILSRALMRDFPQYYHYFNQREFYFRGQMIKGHDHVLDMVAGADGLKTGYTNGSGFNVASSAVENGRRLIAVVMGGSSAAARDNHMEDLMHAGFTVLAQRDRGMTVQFAQNLFEPEPTGPVQRPLVEEGDADQRGLQIVVDPSLPKKVSPYSSTVYRTAANTPAPTSQHQLQVIPADAPQAMALTSPRLTDKACDGPVRHNSRHARKADSDCDKAAAKASRKDDADRRTAREDTAREDGGWIVQVGAFKDRAAARAQLKKVAAKVSGKASVAERENGYYRATFSGMSAGDAHAACASLKAKGEKCMAYRG